MGYMCLRVYYNTNRYSLSDGPDEVSQLYLCLCVFWNTHENYRQDQELMDCEGDM